MTDQSQPSGRYRLGAMQVWTDDLRKVEANQAVDLFDTKKCVFFN
jgi:hypothetical protein